MKLKILITSLLGANFFIGYSSFASIDRTVQLVSNEIIGYTKPVCVASLLPQVRLSEVENVRLTLDIMSLENSRNGERLLVKDSFGRILNTTGSLDLPWSGSSLMNIYVNEGIANDLCISATANKALLKNLTMTFSERGSYGPPNGPGNGPGNRPGRPPERNSIIGELKSISYRGEVAGWACDTRSRAALRLSVYVNGRREFSLAPEANLDVRSDRSMGLPDRACGEMSGFKFQLDSTRFDGSLIDIEVRGQEMRSNNEVIIGRTNFKTPVNRIRRTLFTVGPKVYLSNGQDAFCHISTPDQMRLWEKDGLRVTDQLPEVPAGMRNDGVCANRPFSRGFFESKAQVGTGFFSNGTSSFCAVPLPGMVFHIADLENVNPRAFDKYDGFPTADTMRNSGICMAEGLFSVGPDIYYSNGVNAFCHLTHPDQIGGRKIYKYENLPAGQQNHGDCK